MADSEVKEQQAETSMSSPASQDDTASGNRSSKDRQCPFCAQAFTSSSLGRHLDLYIKPRNPKPADGVHDVVEIKKMRAGITRRQAKTSLKTGANVDVSGWRGKSAESTPTSVSASHQAHAAESRVMEESPIQSPVPMKEREGMKTSVNTANWQATGVINNLPPRAASRDHASSGQAQRIHDMRHDAAGNKTPRPQPEDEHWKLHEDAEVGRAAELALREVLGSLEAAKRKAESRRLFDDVDFFALTFPGLVLAILPPPGTLFTPLPFPSGDAWALTPPGQRQYETLNRLVNLRMREQKQQRPDDYNESTAFKHLAHASGAYEHWQTMSEEDRAGTWTLEVMRAYVTAEQRSQQSKHELEAAQNRIRHLEAEYDRLSRCQLPRELLTQPPRTMPAPEAIMRELSRPENRTAAAEAEYDVDTLLDKWRATIRAHARSHRQPHAEPPAQRDAHGPNTKTLRSDFIMQGSVFGVNGAMPRGPDMHAAARAPTTYDYETPPQPGAIMEAEDDIAAEHGQQESSERANGGSITGYNDCNAALVLQSRATVDGVVNTNGKRPHISASQGGRVEGPKIYREQWSDQVR
ncbi:hypothetical protein LTR86_000238 [Recurvomyces mirabilis]|nr:hypothetical protein LTR86_000238 [Recurvomyces mirabilis]